MQLLILPFSLIFYYQTCLLFHVFYLNNIVTGWLQTHTHGEELTVYSFFKKWKGKNKQTNKKKKKKRKCWSWFQNGREYQILAMSCLFSS